MTLLAFGKGRHWAFADKLLTLMKLTGLLILVTTLHVSAATFSQKVSISGKKLSLQRVFESIEKQTGYQFVYEKDILKKSRFVSLNYKNADLSTVLKKCLEEQNLSFAITTNIIVVTVPTAVPVTKSETAAPVVVITGKVVSQDGEPIVGASVMVKGTSEGTTTTSTGSFVLNVPNLNGTLVVSFVGYTPQEVAIDNRTEINVTLVPSDAEMKDVVVVGYGSQKKTDLTGSVASLTGEDLVKTPATSVDQALQGKVSGVLVTTNSGEPGGGMSVRVRGMGGFGASEPLYVIDGVIITYGDNSFANNPFATLNMNDIESINVLKDASASAIYGARAGNGVVIITTKRGKKGAPKLSFDTYYGIQQVSRKIPMMNAREFAAAHNEARIASNSPTYSKFANPESLGEGTDWQDAIFRTAPMNNYQLSISGGTDKQQYYISGGFLKQDGIIIGSKFNRVSLRINADNQITSWLKIGNSVSLSRTKNNTLSDMTQRFGGIVANALQRSPTLGIYNPDGTWAGPDAIEVSQFLGQIGNPVKVATLRNNPLTRVRILGNMYAEVKLHKNLSFRSNVGVDYVVNSLNQFNASSVEGALPVNPSSAFSSKITNGNILSENTLTYKKDHGNHHFEVLGGYTAQLNTVESVDAFSRNHLNTEVITVDAGSPNDRLAHGARYENSYVSLLGRVNYAFNDKYLFTANVRRDGSSVFSSENKYGIFPSFSAGWRISQEEFMADVPLISDLKLRGSWGQVGIDGGLGGSEYATIASGYLYNFGGTVVPGLTSNVIPNPSLKWETVTQTDLGIDVSILNNRVNITADYFEKKYSDMITQKVVPIYGGISTPDAGGTVSQSVNSATVVNKGIELAINYQNRAGNLYYNIGANFTTFNNKVVKLDEYLVGGNTGNTPQGMLTRTQEGHSVGEFYGWVVDGIFQNVDEVNAANDLDKDPATYYQAPLTAPGDIRFKDLDGDNLITDKDRTFIGSPIPKFVYGVNGEFKLMQFDLNLSLQGSQGNKIVNANRFVSESSAGTENKSKVMVNRWTPTNPSTTVPRVNYIDPNFNDRPSNRFVEDGSYLRLRSIQLGYTLQNNIIERAKLSTVRIYVSATNLFTITKYTGYNPDIGSQNNQNMNNGIDDTIYPQNRSVLAGITIGF